MTTPYGLALSAKVTLVAGMLALAAVNKWRLVPALPAGHPAVVRLRRSISLEAVLALAVFAATTALTNVPPPTGGQAMSDGPGRHTVSVRAGPFDLMLTVVPARPGTNKLDLVVTASVEKLGSRGAVGHGRSLVRGAGSGVVGAGVLSSPPRASAGGPAWRAS